MAQNAYPTGLDLADLLTSTGLRAQQRFQDLMNLDSFVQAAIDDWETRSGYIPFLGNASDVARYYTPQGPENRRRGYGWVGQRCGGGQILDLRAGLWSLTSLAIAYDPNNPTAAQALTLGTDFRLYPENAQPQGRPWTWIRWATPQWGLENSIQIVGKWGWGAAIPDTVFQAILCRAAARCCPTLSLQISRGAIVWEAGGMIRKFANTLLEPQRQVWQATFDETLTAPYKLALI